MLWVNPTTFLKSSLIKLLVRSGVSPSSGKPAKHAVLVLAHWYLCAIVQRDPICRILSEVRVNKF